MINKILNLLRRCRYKIIRDDVDYLELYCESHGCYKFIKKY